MLDSLMAIEKTNTISKLVNSTSITNCSKGYDEDTLSLLWGVLCVWPHHTEDKVLHSNPDLTFLVQFPLKTKMVKSGLGFSLHVRKLSVTCGETLILSVITHIFCIPVK